MCEYILHIGLHKTATKYFQHKLFNQLRQEGFIYNPPKLVQLICDLLKAKEEHVALVLDALVAEKKCLEKKYIKVLISREIMSGDLFSAYDNFSLVSARLSMAFDNPKIICVFRFQTDWLLSCYRESIHEHHYQSIEEFLCIKPVVNGMVKANYKTLDYPKIVNQLKSKFTTVKFMFYENFKEDKKSFVSELLEFLEGDWRLVELPDNAVVANRGYSSLGIKMSLSRYKLLKFLKLDGLLIHRPICFFGDRSVPAGYQMQSVLPVDPYWSRTFKRNNEEVRSANYPNLSFKERLKYVTSWRYLIKRVIDQYIYIDRDLLLSQRDKLNKYFYAQNRKMKVTVPTSYLQKQ